MNFKPKDDVIDMNSGSLATVVSTHTYAEGLKVANIKPYDGKPSKWVPVTELRPVIRILEK